MDKQERVRRKTEFNYRVKEREPWNRKREVNRPNGRTSRETGQNLMRRITRRPMHNERRWEKVRRRPEKR